MLRFLLVTILLYGLEIISLSAKDYCALCPPGQKHIACNNDGSFDKKCSKNAELILMTDKFIATIVTKHNTFRNLVASGSFSGFAPAARMAVMQWDKELQYLAGLNAKRCGLQHSQCFQTEWASNTGQNLAYNKFRDDQNVRKIVKGQITMWTNEYRYANRGSMITGKANGGQDILHFLQVVRDSSDRIGCAIVKDRKDEWIYQYMACIYNVNFNRSEPSYRSAKSAALSCRTGSSQKFRNLCSEKEKYDHNHTGPTNDKTDTAAGGSKSNSNNNIMGSLVDWIKTLDTKGETNVDINRFKNNSITNNTLEIHLDKKKLKPKKKNKNDKN